MPRRTPLVCQYVERLSGQALQDYSDMIREMLGRRHGVYALYRRDKLYYVGLATNLRGRLKAHLRDRHRGLWDRFSVYLTIDDRHLKELESLVIRIAKPGGNKQGGKFARSENLRTTLAHHYNELRRKEWLELIGKTKDADDQSTSPLSRGRRDDPKRPPVLAGKVNRAMALRAKHKGAVFKARVRKDGTIRFGNKTFNSPSMAAVAALGRNMNGWWFWSYERAPGQWVRLRELRRR